MVATVYFSSPAIPTRAGKVDDRRVLARGAVLLFLVSLTRGESRVRVSGHKSLRPISVYQIECRHRVVAACANAKC